MGPLWGPGAPRAARRSHEKILGIIDRINGVFTICSGVDLATARTQVEAIGRLWLRVLSKCSGPGVDLSPARTSIETLGQAALGVMGRLWQSWGSSGTLEVRWGSCWVPGRVLGCPYAALQGDWWIPGGALGPPGRTLGSLGGRWEVLGGPHGCI